MSDRPDLPARRAEGVAALLPWFDAALLAAVGLDEAAVAAFLAGAAVEPANEPPAGLKPDEPPADEPPAAVPASAFRLREELRAEAVARLREDEAGRELVVHARAFDAFLTRLNTNPDGPRAAAEERQLFHHLDRVFYLLAPGYAWDAIADYLARARTFSPRDPANRHLLRFYEAQVALNQERYAAAEELLTASLADPALPAAQRARMLNALALSAMYRNAYPHALRHYEQAHAAAVEAGDLFFQGAALVNMSMVYNDLGDPAEGYRLCQQGRELFERLDDPHRLVIVHYELGNNALYLGRWADARAHLDRSVELAQRLGLDGRLLNAYWALGLLQLFRGDPAACERYYRMALERAEAPSTRVPRLASDIHWHLGFLYMVQGRHAEALAEHDLALALVEGRQPHWRSVIGYQRGRVFEQQGDDDGARMAYAAAIATLEQLREATDDEGVKIRLLGTVNQLYESMVLLCVRQGPQHWAEAFYYVERARSRAFLDSMAHRAPELFATFEQPVATLEELQEALPPDALLLEYFTTGVIPPGENAVAALAAENAPLVAQLTLPPRTLIFAVTRERLEVREAALDPNDLPSPDDPYQIHKLLDPAMLAYLHECLVEPVAELLVGRRMLLLIPHGPLHHVPFGALEDPDGRPLLAGDGPALALAPSATILLRNALARPSAAGAGLAAFGYNHAGERALTYAEAEAALAAQLLGGRAWTGPQPKSDQLFAEAAGARLLHIACHADYDPVDPLATVLHLGVGDALSARTIIERLQLHCDLVTLSACTSGLSKVASGDELLGLPRALLYAGAPAVICTLWEADDRVALLVAYHLYEELRAGAGPAEALRTAVAAVRALPARDVLALLAGLAERWPASFGGLPLPKVSPGHLEHPIYAAPYYWAPFMLIGRP